jgi:YegS/Rv2252/BmrU family lipid kinase
LSSAFKRVPQIEEAVSCIDGLEYEIVYSEKPGHAVSLAKKAAEDRYEIVFAVGGDGTVNEVINGLIFTDVLFSVIPAGSGNDFVRTAGIHGSVKDIIHKSINGSKKLIDAGLVNGRYFINISSVGFDAEAALATQKMKRMFLSGSAAYIAGLIKTIFTKKDDDVTISLNGQAIKEKIILVAVANGKYYGGGMMAAPEAALNDGLLDICCISTMPRLKVLFLFPQFIKGRHDKFREVKFYRTERIEIVSDKLMPVNLDGEVYRNNKVVIEIIKNALFITGF